MFRLFLAAALIACAANAEAASLTVLGRVGGRIYYDGIDVGTIPLRLTAVPNGTHKVRVVANNGQERTYEVDYPRAGDHVIDMDLELGVKPVVQAPPVRAYRNSWDRYDPYGPWGGPYYAPYYGGYGPYYGYPYGRYGGFGFGRRGFGRRGGGLFFGFGF